MNFKAVDRRLEGKTIIEQTRLAELYLLDVFVEICEQYDLRYFLTYGTLIGALRHKGFIPWDDDIDVGMPIEDYDRFLKVAPSVLPPNLLLDHAKTVAGTVGCYAKIRDRSSLFCEPTTNVGLPCGYFLDIFPFEKLPELKNRFVKLCFSLSGISAWSYRSRLRLPYGNVGVMAYGTLMTAIWGLIHFLARTMLSASRMFVASKWMPSPEDNALVHMRGVEDDDLFPVVECEFEGKCYKVPRNSDKCLTQLYGDWRKLPPEKDRVWHADIICPTKAPRTWWAMPYEGGAETPGGDIA